MRSVPRIKRTCRVCEKSFGVRAAELRRPNHNSGSYCSKRCRHISDRNRKVVRCTNCKVRFERVLGEIARRGKRSWCSWACFRRWQVQRLKNYPKIGTRHAHRIMAEKKLGRKLRPGEIVHHIDENRQNYKISNLEIMDRSRHASVHFSGKPKTLKHRRNISRAIQARLKRRRGGEF